MKLVEFTRPVLPWRPGEEKVVSDALAEQLVSNGDAVVKPSVFDQAPAVSENRPRRYLTRDRKALGNG